MEKNDVNYKEILNNLDAIVWEIKLPEFTWTYLSPAIEGLRGYTAEEAKSQTLEEILTTESFEVISKKIQNELTRKPNGNDKQTVKLEHFCKDGNVKWFQVRFSVIRGKDEKPEKIVGVSTDIDKEERSLKAKDKKIEQLEATAEKMKELMKTLPICASCKKIRRDDQSWEQLESYLSRNFSMNFTHGLCKPCSKKLYPDIYKDLHPGE